MVFAAVAQPFVNYYKALPDNIVPTIAQSAGCTLAIALLFSSPYKNEGFDMTRPLMKAGVAALASTIHAAMTPFFDKIFGTAQLDFVSEFIKSSVVAVLSSAVVDCALTSRVNLAAFHLFYLISSNSFTAFFSKTPQVNGQAQPLPAIRDNSIYFCF